MTEPLKGTFMDPEAEWPTEVGGMSGGGPVASSAQPAIVAPSAGLAVPAPAAGPNQAAVDAVLEKYSQPAPPQPSDQERLERVIEYQVATGDLVDPDALARTSPQFQERVRVALNQQANKLAQPRMVRTPYQPGVEERFVPRAQSVTQTSTPGLQGRLEGVDELASDRTITASMRADLERERLQAQFQKARTEAQGLQEQADSRQALFEAQRQAAEQDLAKVRDLSERASSSKIDRGRIFRGNPVSAVAAVLSDYMMARGGRPDLANTTVGMIDRDVAQQQAEYQMLGSQAENAYAHWVREWDGDLKRAELSLKDTQAALLKQQAVQQAAQFGMQELDPLLMEELQKIEEWRLGKQNELAAHAKQQTSETFAFQPGRAASGGGSRPETLAEQKRRLEGERDVLDLTSEIATGRTRKERAEAEAEQAAQAAQQTAETQGLDRKDQVALGEKLSHIVAADLASRQMAEATGGTFDPQTRQWVWAKGENMPGYSAGTAAAVVDRALGVSQTAHPKIAQLEANLVDAFGRTRSGGVIGEDEHPVFARVVLGPRGTEEQVQNGVNITAREATEKRELLEASYPPGVVRALYRRIYEERTGAPPPPELEPRD